MFCYKCGNPLPDEASFCPKCGAKVSHKDTIQQPVTEMAMKKSGSEKNETAEAVLQTTVESIPTKAVNQQIHGVQEKNLAKKKSKKIPIILGIAGLVVIFAIIIAVNWEGKPDYVASVKAHTPFAVSQELPYTYEEVLNKYVDALEWEVREDGEIHYVDINGIVKGLDSEFKLTIKVSANPDVPGGALIHPESITLGGRQSSTEEETAKVLYNLFCMYDEGYEIGEESEFTNASASFYAEHEENAKTIIFEWFERHPLEDNIKIQFTNEAIDGEADGNKYLVYEIYSISGEKYGVFLVNVNNGEMIMDSLIDNSGKWSSIQITMEQWYLEYYWGWTDDSGYYSENYSEDLVAIYDAMDIAILEYTPSNDSYVICNFDGQGFIEYDDGSAASEISIIDFAGTYGYDASFEEEGVFVNFYYSLEIGEWTGYSFSITEEWRGNAILQEEFARPKSLIVDTLTFEVFSSEGLGYETHTLTYIPAKNSPLGQDVIYLDGDDTMPFVRE